MKKSTYSAKPSDKSGKWIVINAEGLVLGRLATQVAARLRGKHLPLFTPHTDVGDYVVVVNAEKVVLTGRKMNQKKYYRHSGYVGGLRTTTARELMNKRPEDLLRFAVKGMLPKNRLGKKMFTKLKVYAGGNHPHAAQTPEILEL